MSGSGLRVGETLANYRGILSGIPNYDRPHGVEKSD